MSKPQKNWLKAFEERADDWQRVYQEDLGHRAHARKLRLNIAVEYLERHCPPGGKEVLDLGCGPGLFSIAAAKLGYQATGADFSENMLANATNNAGRENVLDRCKFVHGDFIKDVVLPQKNFHAIVALGFVEYIFEIDALYRKVTGLLHPSGIFIVQIYNKNSLVSRLNLKTGPLRVINPFVVIPKIVRRFRKNSAMTEGENLPPKREYLARMWYSPAEIDAVMARHGLEKIDFVGHVFGNFSYGDRSLLSENTAIAVDRFLCRLSRYAPFRWLHFVGDNYIAVYKFKKN